MRHGRDGGEICHQHAQGYHAADKEDSGAAGGQRYRAQGRSNPMGTGQKTVPPELLSWWTRPAWSFLPCDSPPVIPVQCVEQAPVLSVLFGSSRAGGCFEHCTEGRFLLRAGGFSTILSGFQHWAGLRAALSSPPPCGMRRTLGGAAWVPNAAHVWGVAPCGFCDPLPPVPWFKKVR